MVVRVADAAHAQSACFSFLLIVFLLLSHVLLFHRVCRTSVSLSPELSTASMWARIGSQWAIYLLYGWTLIAPICCPNRDFS